MFSWDTRKAIRNFEKHHVSFEEAATLFVDPQALDWDDLSHSFGETRSKRLGLSLNGHIILAVYTVRRLENGKKTIRIISARQASRKERQAYVR